MREKKDKRFAARLRPVAVGWKVVSYLEAEEPMRTKRARSWKSQANLYTVLALFASMTPTSQ